MKQNKGTILKCTVDYIKHLKKEVDRAKANQERHRETEELNAKLLLRIKVSCFMNVRDFILQVHENPLVD